MLSPHVIIDKELEALEDPAIPVACSAMVTRTLTEMMGDQRITIEEFNHYCERLNKIVARRKEAA